MKIQNNAITTSNNPILVDTLKKREEDIKLAESFDQICVSYWCINVGLLLGYCRN